MNEGVPGPDFSGEVLKNELGNKIASRLFQFFEDFAWPKDKPLEIRSFDSSGNMAYSLVIALGSEDNKERVMIRHNEKSPSFADQFSLVTLEKDDEDWRLLDVSPLVEPVPLPTLESLDFILNNGKWHLFNPRAEKAPRKPSLSNISSGEFYDELMEYDTEFPGLVISMPAGEGQSADRLLKLMFPASKTAFRNLRPLIKEYIVHFCEVIRDDYPEISIEFIITRGGADMIAQPGESIEANQIINIIFRHQPGSPQPAWPNIVFRHEAIEFEEVKSGEDN